MTFHERIHDEMTGLYGGLAYCFQQANYVQIQLESRIIYWDIRCQYVVRRLDVVGHSYDILIGVKLEEDGFYKDREREKQ